MFNWLKTKLSLKDFFKTDERIYVIDTKGEFHDVDPKDVAYIIDVTTSLKKGDIVVFTKRLYLKDRTNFDFKVDKVHGWWDKYPEK